MQELQRRAPLLGGRYRLGTWLGGGGTADVYRAVDTRLERPVAIKIFRSGTDVNGRARFNEEARLLAGLNHPGLVAVHDADAGGDELYVVMQLIEGKTLADVIGLGPMAPDRVTRLGQKLAEVLDYVHANGIVHRDVKPSNVLISRSGQVFLTDFGISRLVYAAGRMTASGIVMGTATYMAPEQVTDNSIRYPVDIYALGLVLLECVTGRVEYPGMNTEAAIARLTREPEIPDDLSEPLRSVLRAMTVQEPNQRPSAAQCAAMLAGRATNFPVAVNGHSAIEARVTARGEIERRTPAGSTTTPAAKQLSRAFLFVAGPGLLLVACLLVILPAVFQPTIQSVAPPPQLPPVTQPPGTPRLAGDLATLERLAATPGDPQVRNRLVADVRAVKAPALRRDRYATEAALGVLTRDIAAAQAQGMLDPATARVILAAADRVADDIRTLTPLPKSVPPPVVITVPAPPPQPAPPYERPPVDYGPGDPQAGSPDQYKDEEKDKKKGGLGDLLGDLKGNDE